MAERGRKRRKLDGAKSSNAIKQRLDGGFCPIGNDVKTSIVMLQEFRMGSLFMNRFVKSNNNLLDEEIFVVRSLFALIKNYTLEIPPQHTHTQYCL